MCLTSTGTNVLRKEDHSLAANGMFLLVRTHQLSVLCLTVYLGALLVVKSGLNAV